MAVLSWVKENWIILATIAILAGFIILSTNLFSPGLGNPKIVFREAPIQKNTAFQLLPGEQYQYAYLLNGTSANITYAIFQGPGCSYIVTVENMNGTPVCVDQEGMDGGGFNSTLSDPAVLIFKPWMLALREGWTWNNSMYLEYDGGDEYISDTHYRVVRRDAYMNRTVFLVEVKSSTGPADYEWIDAQKRIMLRETGDGYDVRLVSGLPLAGG
jgi:hypothetical protein